MAKSLDDLVPKLYLHSCKNSNSWWRLTSLLWLAFACSCRMRGLTPICLAILKQGLSHLCFWEWITMPCRSSNFCWTLLGPTPTSGCRIRRSTWRLWPLWCTRWRWTRKLWWKSCSQTPELISTQPKTLTESWRTEKGNFVNIIDF